MDRDTQAALVPINGPEIVETKPSSIQEQSRTIFDMPPTAFSAALERRKANRDSLITWLWGALVKGTDYGSIHVVSKDKCPYGSACKNTKHFSKPCLFKPGAEKICGMLGVTVIFPALDKYEARALSGEKIETIVLKCSLMSAQGEVLAQGTGARLVSKDYGDINKSFKMAQKSGQIDATLRLAGLSEIFTQDLEDMVAQAEIVAPTAPEADLTPILEASLRQEPSSEDSARESLMPQAWEGDPCPECNGPISSYVSKKGIPYYQCEFAHDLFLDALAKGKSKQYAGTMTKSHFYQVVP
jgi:hypothetical protein